MSYQDNNINVSCQQNRGQKSTSNGPNKTNYIKKNINFISLLNNNAFLSLENSQVENH